MPEIKKRNIVRDSYGNHFAVDKFHADGRITMHSVITKQVFTVPADEPLTLVPGLMEA